MTATEIDITALQGNDEVYAFTISYGADRLDLSNLTSTFYLKASRNADDNTAYTAFPTVTSAILGEMSVTIPRAQLSSAGTLWYRIDVENIDNQINTVIFGVVNVLAV